MKGNGLSPLYFFFGSPITVLSAPFGRPHFLIFGGNRILERSTVQDIVSIYIITAPDFKHVKLQLHCEQCFRILTRLSVM